MDLNTSKDQDRQQRVSTDLGQPQGGGEITDLPRIKKMNNVAGNMEQQDAYPNPPGCRFFQKQQQYPCERQKDAQNPPAKVKYRVVKGQCRIGVAPGCKSKNKQDQYNEVQQAIDCIRGTVGFGEHQNPDQPDQAESGDCPIHRRKVKLGVCNILPCQAAA